MERDSSRAFLGVGFKFPIQVDENTGRMKTSSYEEDIQEAIRIILSTRPGERLRNPNFGCGIYDYAFGTMDYTTLSAMQREVKDALIQWEPRIENISVRVVPEEDEGRVDIYIDYVVRTTNNPFNMVYPFFITEGFGG
ncbi:MAG: GPW/gp25 family protein [Eubacterium sp.]|nr:GPW/gp25 family protein [Eubacterium sp.]